MTKFTADRKRDIMRRAQQYADGELSLEDFMLLEQVDNEFMEDAEEPEQEPNYSETAEQLKALYEQELEQEEAKKRPPAERVIKGERHTITTEDWEALSLFDKNELYNKMPEQVGKFIRGEADSFTYTDADITIPRYTVEEWRQLSIKEMQYVYDNDKEQALELMEASRELH